MPFPEWIFELFQFGRNAGELQPGREGRTDGQTAGTRQKRPAQPPCPMRRPGSHGRGGGVKVLPPPQDTSMQGAGQPRELQVLIKSCSCAFKDLRLCAHSAPTAPKACFARREEGQAGPALTGRGARSAGGGQGARGQTSPCPEQAPAAEMSPQWPVPPALVPLRGFGGIGL